MSEFEAELEADVPRGLPGIDGKLVEAEYLHPEELRGPQWRYRGDGSNDDARVTGIVLGYREIDGRDVGCGTRDDRHLLTVAGSRAGKGVSLLVPNLLLYDGSVLVIDPKGELARVTARARREKGQKVVILDPFNENGRHERGSFNPLDELDPRSRSVVIDAGAIADAMITASGNDQHWTDSARILLRSLILFTLTLDEPAERNLVTVRRLLMLTHPMVKQTMIGINSKKAEEALFHLLGGCAEYEEVRGTGLAYLAMAERERSSILSTARTQTDFLGDERMQDSLCSSSLKLSELKTGNVTLYLCLPATRMSTHSRWLRIIVNLAVAAMEMVKPKPAIPVLFMLDEFHVLGHMKSVETAAGLMAGFGVKLWVVLQDLSQIKGNYKDTWETFVGNAGVLTAWGNSDNSTLEYVSNRLGQTGVRTLQPSGATPAARLSGASATREELRVQKLLGENEMGEVLAREKNRILVSAAGRRPVILKRITYFRDGPFKGHYDSHELTAEELKRRDDEEDRIAEAARKARLDDITAQMPGSQP